MSPRLGLFSIRALGTVLGAASLLPGNARAQTRPAQATAHNGRHALADPDANDPDIPAFAHGSIDNATYLRLRAAHIARLRGLDTVKDPKARVQAIQQMHQQEIERDARISAAAAATRSAASNAAVPSVPVALGLSNSPWQPIGPAPIPNGQTCPFPINGCIEFPVSGRVTAIAVHPTNPNIVYIGAAQGGVWRSLDGGATWTPLMDTAQSLAIGAIAIAPSQLSTIFVGTGEGNFSGDSFFGVGVYRIDNADGISGSPTLVGPFHQDTLGNDVFTGRSITRILVHPLDANTIFVGTSSGFSGLSGDVFSSLPGRGVFRSSNAMLAPGSVTFSKLTGLAAGNNRAIADMVLEPGNPNNLTVLVVDTGLGNGGIYHSTNALASPAGAVSFINPVVTPSGGSLPGDGKLAINTVGSTVTVVAATGEGNGMLRKSTDGGVTWGPLAGGAGFCGKQCFYDIAIAIDPANANLIYLGGSTNPMFAISTDGGAAFINSQAHLHADTHAIVLAPPNSSTIYEGNDGGIFKSTNSGSTWNTSLNNTGLGITQFQSLALHPLDRQFMIGGTQDNGTPFLRPDATWLRADFGDGGYSLIDNNASDTTTVTMYHTYFNKRNNLIGMARTRTAACATEGQWSFQGIYGGTVDPTVWCDGTTDSFNGINITNNVNFYAPMALGPGNPNTVYFGTDRLYRSIDQGTNMTVVSQQPFGQNVSAIGISPQNDNVRIVGLNNGQVFATTTGANPLTDVTSFSLSFPVNYVARAVIDPNNSNTAYVTFDGYGLAVGAHVWKTTNLAGGAGNWTARGNGIPDVPVNAFVADPLSPNNLYAGTDIGVYASTDGGASWNPFGSGLPRVAVFDMAIENSNRVLRIATHGRGIWEISLSQPTQFQVAAPANSTAGASFNVTVTVLDANGQPVPSYRGTVHFTSSDLQATLPADYTFTSADNGTHMFSAALVTLGSQTITVTDTLTSSLKGTSTISVSPGPATRFTVSANPASTAAGSPVSIAVTAYDAFSNIATGYRGTVHFTSSDGQAVLPVDYTFVVGDNGAHTFPGVILRTAGNPSITVRDTVTASISGSINVAVSALAASQYSITVPPTVTAGTLFTVRLVAQDQFGNTAHNYLGTVHFTSSDVAAGVILPANYTFTTLDNGIHLFSNAFKLQTAGSQTITATDTTTPSITATVALQVVTDLPLTGVARTIRLRSGTIPVVVATFTDADPAAAPGDFSVSILWGDGTSADTTSAIVTQAGGQFIVTAKHSYARKGIFTVKVTVKDTGGSIVDINSTASFFPRTFSF